MFAIVPVVRYFSVAGPRLRADRSLPTRSNCSRSKTGAGLRPLTAMAFRFFDPITAPVPVRPACLPPSLAMLANLTPFSPAGPMQATLNRRPSLSRTVCSVFDVPNPNRSDASSNLTVSSSITSSVGWALLPVITRASHPVRFNSTARKLELSESPIMPVSGDLAATANLLEVVSLLPMSGLHANMSGLSGPSGSAPGGQCR